MSTPEKISLEFTTYYDDELTVRAGIADGLTDSSATRFFANEDPLTIEDCEMLEEIYLPGISEEIEKVIRYADSLGRCALADPSKLMITLMYDDELSELFSDSAMERLNFLTDIHHLSWFTSPNNMVE